MNIDFSLHYRSLVPSQMGQRVAGGGLGVTFVTLVAFSPLKLTGWDYFIITFFAQHRDYHCSRHIFLPHNRQIGRPPT